MLTLEQRNDELKLLCPNTIYLDSGSESTTSMEIVAYDRDPDGEHYEFRIESDFNCYFIDEETLASDINVFRGFGAASKNKQWTSSLASGNGLMANTSIQRLYTSTGTFTFYIEDNYATTSLVTSCQVALIL